MVEDSIWIVTNETELTVEDGRKGWGEEIRNRLLRVTEVKLSAVELERKMEDFLQIVGRLFKQVDQQTEMNSGMRLSEVELLIEISTKGEVKLVAGGEATGKGAIKLKFTKMESK